MTEIIRLENITKKYDGRVILKDIQKVFYKGQSIAFVGHNGCGKSTLLKVIAKLVAPTLGKVIYHDPLLFHYVPEKFTPLSLTARTYLMRMGELDGLKKEEAKQKIQSLGEDFFLSELLDTSMRSLSKGTLQKIGVIQTLLKKPDVLLLDEPLSGQDADSQEVFIEKISQLRKQGVTVFMSCHEQSLIQAIAEEVYCVEDGSLKRYKQPRQASLQKIYTIVLENGADLPWTRCSHTGGIIRCKFQKKYVTSSCRCCCRKAGD